MQNPYVLWATFAHGQHACQKNTLAGLWQGWLERTLANFGKVRREAPLAEVVRLESPSINSEEAFADFDSFARCQQPFQQPDHRNSNVSYSSLWTSCSMRVLAAFPEQYKSVAYRKRIVKRLLSASAC